MPHVIPAEHKHLAAIVHLCVEMNEHYGEMPGAHLDVIRALVDQALFNPPPGGHIAAQALLAFAGDDETDIVGFAAYSDHWPAAALARSMFLKELYVMRAARRGGVGQALMDELFRIAEACGYTRVEWTTERDNSGAQEFYASLGAADLPEKVFYRHTLNV